MPTPPPIKFTSRDEARILAEIDAVIAATAPELWTNSYQSSLGTALRRMLARVGGIASGTQDVLCYEFYPITAMTLEPMLRSAASVGYQPLSAFSATCTVKTDTVPLAVTTNGGVVPKGTILSGANGLPYEVTADFAIPAGTTVFSLDLRQGQTFSETFTPTSAPDQEFVTARGVVEQNLDPAAAPGWKLYVGDTSSSLNLWTRVGDLGSENGATNTYEAFIDSSGRLHIVTGDGEHGAIPGDVMTLIYRTCAGFSGNAVVGSVSGVLKINVVGGGVASVSATNITAATGGKDRQDVDALRKAIPAYMRQRDQVITSQDFVDGIVGNTGAALAYVDSPVTAFSANVNRINVWDDEATDFTVVSPASALSSTATYHRYTTAATARKNEIQSYLNANRKPVCVYNVVIRPSVAWVDLSFGNVRSDGYTPLSEIHAAVVAAIVKVFEEGDGFSMRLASLYDAVLGVKGVRYFTIASVQFEHLDFQTPFNGNVPNTVTEYFRQDPTPIVGEVALPGGASWQALRDLTIPAANSQKFYDDTYLYNNEITYDDAALTASIQAVNLRSLQFELI